MIIGINGKIGSGKDTVANMILDNIAPFYQNTFIQSDIHKFAGPLKRIASILTGVPVEQFEDQEFKKTQMPPEWGDMTYRTFLQRLGTEAIRDNIHTNAWVNAALSGYTGGDGSQLDLDSFRRYVGQMWLMTDMRFTNEYEACKSRGITVLVRRPSLPVDPNPHISETQLDHIQDWDIIVENDGTLDDLEKTVQSSVIRTIYERIDEYFDKIIEASGNKDIHWTKGVYSK